MIARIAQAAVVVSVGVAYAALLAGVVGALDARAVSLIALIGATSGTIGAGVYFAAASRQLRRPRA